MAEEGFECPLQELPPEPHPRTELAAQTAVSRSLNISSLWADHEKAGATVAWEAGASLQLWSGYQSLPWQIPSQTTLSPTVLLWGGKEALEPILYLDWSLI